MSITAFHRDGPEVNLESDQISFLLHIILWIAMCYQYQDYKAKVENNDTIVEHYMKSDVQLEVPGEPGTEMHRPCIGATSEMHRSSIGRASVEHRSSIAQASVKRHFERCCTDAIPMLHRCYTLPSPMHLRCITDARALQFRPLVYLVFKNWDSYFLSILTETFSSLHIRLKSDSAIGPNTLASCLRIIQ